MDTEIDSVVGMNSDIFDSLFMSWGRYKRKIFKYYMMVSFQFHHTWLDGTHIGRFLEDLQREIKSIG